MPPVLGRVTFNTSWSYGRERAAHTRLTKKMRRHMPALHTRRVCRIRLSVTAGGASSVRLPLGLPCAVSRCRSIICKIGAASPSGPCVELAQYLCYPDNRRCGMEVDIPHSGRRPNHLPDHATPPAPSSPSSSYRSARADLRCCKRSEVSVIAQAPLTLQAATISVRSHVG